MWIKDIGGDFVNLDFITRILLTPEDLPGDKWKVELIADDTNSVAYKGCQKDCIQFKGLIQRDLNSHYNERTVLFGTK